jgi:hypothetical protein
LPQRLPGLPCLAQSPLLNSACGIPPKIAIVPNRSKEPKFPGVGASRVISGEFGRTQRVNGSAGRDHWAPLSTLAFACGDGLTMGQVIGESSVKAETPKSMPIGPQDLMATLFHVLGIDPAVSFHDPTGRPTPMLTEGHPIAELV